MKILESSVDPMSYFSANLCLLSIIVVGLLAVGDFGSSISVFKQPFRGSIIVLCFTMLFC